ncbi:sphinganine kinase lcb4 [Coniochaeta pulveracea]|uniref:Sphinganine kinase lcb4 n=1 Tax=Coniochaeta pulveracea TaxID=177199 RepID=A0A420XWD3_9PEZI|nr:sphinganine kinase lcb4 [Coniochaeta pulveracea]
MTIGDSTLYILDINAKRSTRTSLHAMGEAGPGQATHSIPLRNILWFHVDHLKRTQQTVISIAYVKEERKWQGGSYLKPTRYIRAFRSPKPTDDLSHFASTVQVRAYGRAQSAKRAFVLINPHAGKGNAVRVFENEVRPIFDAAHMKCHVILTERVGHGVDLVKEMDITAHDVIVACSGDGLPHECFNGLAQRPDPRLALEAMPVVMIPCGSGNGMALNLFGTHKASYAALGIVKGVRTPLDLVSITQGTSRSLSFLSQAFGLMADLDLGTEHMRKILGNQRFFVGFMQRVFQKKTYPCDIHVKVEIEQKAAVKELYRERTQRDLGDAAERHRADTGDSTSNQLPDLKYGTVNNDIPEDWQSIPGSNIGNFYCGNMAYMAPDANFFPAAMPNDGFIDLVTTDGTIPPLKAIQMQQGVETGHFFDNPLVEYRKISAYRLTPHNQEKGGHVSIDGEHFDFAPFQAEVHEGLGTTLTLTGYKYEAPGPKDWDRPTTRERVLA